MKKATITILLVLAFLASGARAQEFIEPSNFDCADHAKLTERLTKKFKETRLGVGITKGNEMVEVFVGPDGSFTIILTNAKKKSCVATLGDNWQTVFPGEDS